VGLPAIFVVAFVSATILPMATEPVLFGFVKLNPDLFWPAVAVATVGNTLGGMVTYFMGYGAHELLAHDKPPITSI
jgi:membrane protein YqaA with SNARE-associated domain